jgi:hypothetical protein
MQSLASPLSLPISLFTRTLGCPSFGTQARRGEADGMRTKASANPAFYLVEEQSLWIRRNFQDDCGCDFHPSWQQVALFDFSTGEIVEHKLVNGNGEAERFYRPMLVPSLIGRSRIQTGPCKRRRNVRALENIQPFSTFAPARRLDVRMEESWLKSKTVSMVGGTQVLHRK